MAQAVTQERALRPQEPAWVFVLAVFAASRLLILTAGYLLVGVLPPEPYHLENSDVPFGTMSIWSHYDGEHYVSAILHGYEHGGGASPAFFPLYPLAVRSVAELVGVPLTRPAMSVLAMLVSLTLFPLALWFLYQLTEKDWGRGAAQAAVLTLAFFPTSFFFNSAYSESLFLVLSSGAIWAARVRRNFLAACLFAGLATATRNVGVFLLLPLLAEWWRHRRHYRSQLLMLPLALSGLLAYSVFLWRRLGDPLLFVTEQTTWGRRFRGVFEFFPNAARVAFENAAPLVDLDSYRPLNVQHLLLVISGVSYFYNFLTFLLALTILLLVARRLPFDLVLYATGLVLLPALFGTSANPMMTLPRFILMAFPVFMGLGILLRSRRLLTLWVAVSGALSLPLIALVVNWYFVA